MYPSRPAPPKPDVAPYLAADSLFTFTLPAQLSTHAAPSHAIVSSAVTTPLSSRSSRESTCSASSRSSYSTSASAASTPLMTPAPSLAGSSLRSTRSSPRPLRTAFSAPTHAHFAPPVPALVELAVFDQSARYTLLRDIETILGKKLHFPVLSRRRQKNDAATARDKKRSGAHVIDKADIKLVGSDCESDGDCAWDGVSAAAMEKRAKWTSVWV